MKTHLEKLEAAAAYLDDVQNYFGKIGIEGMVAEQVLEVRHLIQDVIEDMNPEPDKKKKYRHHIVLRLNDGNYTGQTYMSTIESDNEMPLMSEIRTDLANGVCTYNGSFMVQSCTTTIND